MHWMRNIFIYNAEWDAWKKKLVRWLELYAYSKMLEEDLDNNVHREVWIQWKISKKMHGMRYGYGEQW